MAQFNDLQKLNSTSEWEATENWEAMYTLGWRGQGGKET